MSDLSEPQCGEIIRKVETKEFKTLAEAFQFLDEEWQEISARVELFRRHVKELVTQIVRAQENHEWTR